MGRDFAYTDDARNRFLNLKSRYTKSIAFFLLCAVCDIAFIPDCDAEDWGEYVMRIGSSKRFADGETDFHMAEESEKSRQQRWEESWGFGSDEIPYTTSDYIRLDELFKSYSSRLVSAGGYDKQQEDTLRHCCRLALLRDKCVSKGGKDGVDMASKLDKMIQENLSSENLRKKDAKPVETAMIDGFLDAMRKKYGCDRDMTVEQCKDAISRWMISHRYPMTMDAAEHELMCIINATRKNNDEPEMTELPRSMRFPAKSPEFEPVPNDNEEAVYSYLNLEREH